MIFLDTNILVYAFSKNVDNEKQKQLSQEILSQTVLNKKLILSDIILCEFAFVSKKIDENKNVISQNLEYLSKYVKQANVSKRLVETLHKSNGFKSSFDIHHACFCEEHKCEKLLTFDKGFRKIEPFVNTKIEIISIP